MKRLFFLSAFLLIIFTSSGQTAQKAFDIRIDSILAILNRVEKAPNDSVKLALAERSAYYMQEILINPSSWRADLSRLKKKITILEAPDKTVKVFTWPIPLSDDYYYIGFVQRFDKKSRLPYSYRLYDQSSKIKDPAKRYLSPQNWYGAVYYEIIPFKYRKKKVYVLLGSDPADQLVNRKIIEFMTFKPSGEPRFGYDVKDELGQPVKRFIFEYNNQAAMLLRWNEDMKMIVFDHLSPSKPKFIGLHQFYGPDFSYDGLKFEKGKFIYEIDIDVRDKNLK